MARIGVVVLTHDQKEVTLHFLEKFTGTFGGRTDVHLLLLDSGSQDGTYEEVRSRYPNVDIRKLRGNLGCAKGRNVGIMLLTELNCEYYCSLDNDIVIEDPVFFDKLLKRMDEDTSIDAVSPIVRWADDRRVQTIGYVMLWCGYVRNLTAVGESTVTLSVIPGGACFVRMNAFRKHGIYDNSQSAIGAEDVEWGLRVVRNGAKLCPAMDCEVFHHHDRKGKISRHKMAMTIRGRVILHRRHPSFLGITIELGKLICRIVQYGLNPTLQAYLRAMEVPLDDLAYSYHAFHKEYGKWVIEEPG